MGTQIVSQTSNLDDTLFRIRTNWEFSAVILTVAGILISIETTRDIGILTGLICVLTFYLNFKSLLSTKNQKKKIQNVQDIPDETSLIIDRTQIAERIVNSIINSKDGIVNILVGTSGSGKSILIREFFPEQYQNHFKDDTTCKQLIFKSYVNIEKDLTEGMFGEGLIDNHHLSISDALCKIKKNQRIFFIFDQFESIFMLEHKDAIRQLKTLCNMFSTLNDVNKKDNIKMIYCLIVMRKEWYFNLKFFGDLIPHLSKTEVLEGFNIQDEELIEKIKSKLYLFTNEDSLTEEIVKECSQISTSEGFYVTSCEELKQKSENKGTQTKVILPIELMTVAESVFIFKRENSNKGAPFNFEGRDRALRRFFDYYLMSFQEKYDAMQILYSLSVSPKERRMLSSLEISNITNISLDRVDKVLTYFLGKEENGEKSKERKPLLIQDKESKKVDWKHDFFAEHCSEISGSMLDPIDRDNINFFWYNRGQNNSDSKTIFPSQNLFNSKAQDLGATLFIISFLLLLLRTFYPLFKKMIPIDSFRSEFSVPLFSIPEMNWVSNIDYSFLPIFISLTLWSWYVTTAYRRLFSILKEPTGSFAAKCSVFVAWWSLICVSLTILFPLLWIFFTGVGGLIVGLKYQQMTKLNNSVISTFEETFMKRLYKETKINSIVMMVIGFFYSLLFPQFIQNELYSSNWYIGIVLTALFLVIMVYFALLSIREHTYPGKIPSYLGVYNRYKY